MLELCPYPRRLWGARRGGSPTPIRLPMQRVTVPTAAAGGSRRRPLHLFLLAGVLALLTGCEEQARPLPAREAIEYAERCRMDGLRVELIQTKSDYWDAGLKRWRWTTRVICAKSEDFND